LYEASVEGSSNAIGVAIGIGIVGMIVGGVAAYYLTKFANAYFLPIMAFACGGIATFMLTTPMKLN
jgi:zinc transporter ZupT